MWRNRNPVLCWWECTSAAAVENNTVPQHLSSELPIDSAIPLLELKAETQTDMCTPMLTAVPLTTDKRWRQPKSPLTD